MRDLIFISLENWDGVWRRNQFLCAEWLRRFPAMRLLFVGRSRDMSHSLRMGERAAFTQPAEQKVADFPGLTILNPLKLLPNSFPPARWANQRLMLAEVRLAAQRAGLRAPLLWINDHFGAHLAGKLGERAVIYDVTDDWALMNSIPQNERQRIREADAALCKSADLVVVCSEALERARRGLSRKLVRIPNGVDAERYGSGTQSACDSEARAGRTFGYVGTLHGDRLDLELVTALARRRPLDRVVLCGPNLLTAREVLQLNELANIELRAAVDYQQVPRLLDEFDVCILPHRCTPFTESLNPIKLWEYLASGRPVAATPVAGFRDYGHLFHLAKGEAGFLGACEKALHEDARLAGVRMREAARHSWKMRADDLLEIFRQEGWMARNPLRRTRTQSGTRRTQRRAEVAVGQADLLASEGV
jgi:teichuronic acid biosynthesis glycosyltransferase TuaH